MDLGDDMGTIYLRVFFYGVDPDALLVEIEIPFIISAQMEDL